MNSVLNGVAVALAGALFAAPSVSAQSASFSLGGGLSIPTGDYNTIAKLGWHAATSILLAHESRPYALQIDANYAQFGLEAESPTGSFDVNQRFIYGTGNLVYRFQKSPTGRLRPYVIGGIGVYNSKGTGRDAALFGNTSATDVGVNLGTGFDYRVAGAALFLEARFHNIFSDPSDTQYVPVTAGLRFGG
jgi:hypothetical protein